jgi:hypothetical protein
MLVWKSFILLFILVPSAAQAKSTLLSATLSASIFHVRKCRVNSFGILNLIVGVDSSGCTKDLLVSFEQLSFDMNCE